MAEATPIPSSTVATTSPTPLYLSSVTVTFRPNPKGARKSDENALKRLKFVEWHILTIRRALKDGLIIGKDDYEIDGFLVSIEPCGITSSLAKGTIVWGDRATQITAQFHETHSYTTTNNVRLVLIQVANYEGVLSPQNTIKEARDLSTSWERELQNHLAMVKASTTDGILLKEGDTFSSASSPVVFTVVEVLGEGTCSTLRWETHVHFLLEGLHGLPLSTPFWFCSNRYFLEVGVYVGYKGRERTDGVAMSTRKKLEK